MDKAASNDRNCAYQVRSCELQVDWDISLSQKGTASIANPRFIVHWRPRIIIQSRQSQRFERRELVHCSHNRASSVINSLAFWSLDAGVGVVVCRHPGEIDATPAGWRVAANALTRVT